MCLIWIGAQKNCSLRSIVISWCNDCQHSLKQVLFVESVGTNMSEYSHLFFVLCSLYLSLHLFPLTSDMSSILPSAVMTFAGDAHPLHQMAATS